MPESHSDATSPAQLDLTSLQKMGLGPGRLAVIIVDHGSRYDESNQVVQHIVDEFRRQTGLSIVEPAHMDLAPPSLQQAFDRAAQQGAEMVIVFPFLLAPGMHWRRDIPQLASEAARSHPGLRFLVAEPLGSHPLLATIVTHRVEQRLERAVRDKETGQA